MYNKAVYMYYLLTYLAATRNDPCLPGNHATLDQPDRSTAISIGSGKLFYLVILQVV